MTALVIDSIKGRQILDSRGRPTVEADVLLSDGSLGRAAVPSGASTGAAEAHELRDGDQESYEGLGVTRAVANVDGELAGALKGRDALDQAGIDRLMAGLDGTSNLSRLGANAVLAVSMALCRAAAAATGRTLHARIAELAGSAPSMPMPMVNVLSGGLHAGRGMDVQDFLAVPVGATTYSQALSMVSRVRSAAGRIAAEAGITTLLADEGGLSPGYAEAEEALDHMVGAIERAGLRPGEDVAIALDVAASSLVDPQGRYVLARAGRVLDSAAMAETVAGWAARYPVISIEDPLHEEDWSNWQALTGRLGHLQLIGDDLFSTQAARIAEGIRLGVANSALIKLNQNGTVSGTLEAVRVARQAGYSTVISARSGETEDSFIADLAVGLGAGQIKIGSVRSSERLAKYNQLLRIEEQAGLGFAGAAALRPERAEAQGARA